MDFIVTGMTKADVTIDDHGNVIIKNIPINTAIDLSVVLKTGASFNPPLI